MAAGESEWFIEALRRQFADHELEENGVTLEFYLDAKNVRGAAVGVQALTGNAPATLDDGGRETLVECLFSAGWLGPIRMLAPHQAEFLGLLTSNLDVGDEREFAQRTNTYLRGLEFVDSTAWAIHEISQHSLAQRTFKAIELTRLYWTKKVAQWRRDGLLRTDTLPTDFAGMIGSTVYKKLRQGFDNERNNKRSNLADAAALTALAAEIEHFRTDSRPSRLPLFFAPKLFLKVVAEVGLADRFEYKAGNETYSVLCDAEYFIFRSILYPVEDVTSNKANPEIRTRLEEVRRKLQRMIATNKSMDEMLLELVADDRYGRFDADQLRNYSFFDQVWLPVASATEIKDGSDLRSIVELMQSAEVQDAIQTNLTDLTSDLRHNTLEYLRARRLQQKLSAAVAKLKVEIPAGILHDNPFDILGLLRFSFPPDARGQLSSILRRFGESRRENDDDDASPDPLTRGIFKALWSPRRPSDAKTLALNAGLLWIAKLYGDILDRIGPHRNLHFSLIAVYGAAAVESERPDLAARAAQELETCLHEATRPATRGAIHVALSYLQYHRAQAEGFTPCWQLERLSVETTGIVGTTLVERAIEHARNAARSSELDEPLHVYALNLAVFYGVALPMSDRTRLRQLTVQLLQYKQRPVWQYRYEDTIARYFFLGALEATSEEEVKRILDFAERHVGNAAKQAPHDSRISMFEAYLNIIRPTLEARLGDKRNSHQP
jgi:hypothetical protein